MKLICFALLIFTSLTASCAHADGSSVEDVRALSKVGSETRKVVDGFSGWLLVASEEDFEIELDTALELAHSVSEVDAVDVGQSILVVILFANPALDADQAGHVRCDVRSIRPDQKVTVMQEEVACLEGRLPVGKENRYVPGLIMRIKWDPTDSKGEWTVSATLKDVVRGSRIDLKKSFVLN